MKKMKQLIAGLLSVCLILSGIGDLTAYASPITSQSLQQIQEVKGSQISKVPEVSPLNGRHQKVGMGENGTVYVSVRNDTYTKAEGAPWDSSLFGEGEDEYVPVEIIPGETDTIMTAFVHALEKKGFQQSGAQSNYITMINGLSAADNGSESGWSVTYNDWFTNQSSEKYHVSDGDIITLRYSSHGWGADLGGAWDNNTTTLQSLSFNKGELDSAFQETNHTYTLKLPSDADTIKVTPTAVNKNYQTRIYKNATVDFENASIPAEKNYEEMLSGLAEWDAATAQNLGYYKRTQEIPVVDGDVITVACGLSYWNTMNTQVEGNIYTIKIEKEKQPVGESISSIKAIPGIDLSVQPYEMLPAFQSGVTDYKIVVPDTKSIFGIALTTASNVTIDEIAAEWTATDGKNQRKIISPNSSKGIILSQILKSGGSSNTCKITVKGSNSNGHKIEEIYNLTIIRERTLSDLKVKDTNGAAITLNPTKFSGTQTAYSCNVLKTSKNVEIEAVPYSTEDDQYQVYVNGALVKNGDKTKVSISQNSTIPIKVSHLDGTSKESTYTLSVNRVLESSEIQITTVPSDATVFVTGTDNKRILANENRYQLENGKEYTIVATKYGYLGKQQTITAGEQQEYQITLSEATENKEIDTTIPSEWPNFRGNDENNAVVSSKIPVSANNATLYWAAKYGEGFDTKAPSSLILVDNTLVFTAGNKIAKLDTATGEVLVSGNMITTSAFNITPPTYADGILFVALKDGIVQAFNADTLESLWVYHDPLKGQPNSPITYHNGYVYTGFWQGENREANWVCLSATDEDLTAGEEEKLATFNYTRLGGFYWAGAYVCDQFLLVGTDDGKTGYTSMTSSLLSMNPITGEVMDEMTGFDADIRSSISYDKDTDRYYFTSKGGTFYSIKMNKEGTFDKQSLQTLDIGGMSTSTPVVHHGRAYIGVSGTGQFTAYSGHRIAVIDLDSFTIAYTCKTQGYPQTSGLLTTAYEESTGYAAIYFIDNYTPGKIRVIKDRKGQTVMEEDESISYAPILFTPSGGQAQYAICSPIVDSYGTMYFKNDSAHMMALGSKIKEIKVTRKPKKTTYTSGEVFDATGMCVTATLENGIKRDITEEVSYSDTPLSVYDSEVAIEYKHVLYQDMDKDTSKETTDLLKDQNQSGMAVKAPVTYAEIGVYAMNAPKEEQGLTIRTPKDYEYTGEVIKPEMVLKYEDKVLTQEVDYTLSYCNNKNVNKTPIKENGIGENYNSKLPTIVIKGKGSYKKLIKTTKVNFTIYEKALNTDEFVSYVCDGKVTKRDQTPKPIISFEKINLKDKRDYEIKGYCTSEIYQNYADNETELIKHLSKKVKDVGTYHVVVTGKGNYSGTITCKFEMKTPENYLLLSKCKIAKLPKKTYTGSAITLSMNEIVLTYQGKVISADNYEVLYKNHLEAGKAMVILNGKNHLSGSKTLTFVIDKKDINDTSIAMSTIQNQTYTGKKLTPKLTVTDQSVIDLYGDTKELKTGKDMTIAYQNNVKVADGTAKKKPTVIIKGKGNYKGTRKITFTISK